MTSPAPALLYWEDVGPQERVGPFVIGAEQVASLAREVGPLSDAWAQPLDRAAGPRVPDLFLHAFIGGHVWDGRLAIVCIRSATYEPVRHLLAGERFYVSGRILKSEAIDERMGAMEYERSMVSESGEVISRGVTRMLLLRRGSEEGDRRKDG